MAAAADFTARVVFGGYGACDEAARASDHDIPHPIGDPDEDEELPGENDDDEDDDEEPMQL